uniref:Uncharacterized protein n=1 Tax=Timema poppense TaxID=170557 RepID=A0A7R9CWR9_TIMPO|nr:unnamed protein product [Timema poppensis]
MFRALNTEDMTLLKERLDQLAQEQDELLVDNENQLVFMKDVSTHLQKELEGYAIYSGSTMDFDKLISQAKTRIKEKYLNKPIVRSYRTSQSDSDGTQERRSQQYRNYDLPAPCGQNGIFHLNST